MTRTILRIAFLAVGVLAWQPVHAAIMFDAKTDGGLIGTIPGGGPTLNISHPIAAGSNRVAFVCTYMLSDTVAHTVDTVTIAGVSATLVRKDTQFTPTSDKLETTLWKLVAPTTGTPTVAITWSANPYFYGTATVLTFQGADQTTPVETNNGANDNSGILSTSMTTITDHAWTIDCGQGLHAAGLTVGSGQTSRSNRIVGITVDGLGASTIDGKTPVGTATTTWAQTSAYWVQSAAVIRPAPTTGSDVLAVVQSCTMATANNSPTASCMLPSLPAVGNTVLLLMSFGQFGSGLSTCLNGGQVVDSLGSYFDLAVESPLSGRVRSYIWLRSIFSPPGGSYGVTVTCPSASWITMQAIEVSGLVQSYSAYDNAGWAGAIGAVSSTVTAFGTTAQPNELAVAVVTTDRATSLTITKDAAWTQHYEQENCDTSGAGSICGSAVSQILSEASIPVHTWVFSAGADSAAALATFRTVQSGIGSIVRSLTWRDTATNETAYRVQKRTDHTTPNWVDVATGLPPDTTSYAAQISTLETGDCWRVIAENQYGSGVSEEVCAVASGLPLWVPLSPPVLQIGGQQTVADEELL